MKISIVGLKDYIIDGVIKGVTVHGVRVDNILNGYGSEVFRHYFSKVDSSELELGEIYEVEFDYYNTQQGLMARPIGLRKEDEYCLQY